MSNYLLLWQAARNNSQAAGFYHKIKPFRVILIILSGSFCDNNHTLSITFVISRNQKVWVLAQTLGKVWACPHSAEFSTSMAHCLIPDLLVNVNSWGLTMQFFLNHMPPAETVWISSCDANSALGANQSEHLCYCNTLPSPANVWLGFFVL